MRGHDVRLAVEAADQVVCLNIVLETLVPPVNLQPWAERDRPGVDIDLVSRQVLHQSVEHRIEDWNIPYLGEHLLP